ncbi:hypothetical protein pipiens_007099 [Culex pipiens pipiens]|uniref:Rho-GAP domain-containing protein n=1 Tax=Culex pipiens pipiens TaxID=38569 RepID=A0ABD1DM75_CULPP
MLINDVENKEELFNIIVSELRSHGIKYRKEKRSKPGQDKLRCRRIFNVPLHTLELTDVILANGGIAQVPLFVSDACQRILEQVHTEGLFRKAGSSKRQQEIKANLESGIPLGKSHHVIDVANILKTFFRDLPEPLLPTGNIQEALIRCLLAGEQKVYDLMITCLLLPPITLNTLAFFLQFLHTVSLNSNVNKMTVENLAIILTPNLMPIAEMIQQRLTSHVKVIQLLIENSHQIGVIPLGILEKLNETVSVVVRSTDSSMMTGGGSSNTDKKKKKRRSGSLTRMIHGLMKKVGAKGSSECLDKTDEHPDMTMAIAATPCLNKSSKKRKVVDGMPFSAKKKKEVVSSLPDNQEILPYTPIAIMKETKKSRLSLGGHKNKQAKSANQQLLVPSTSTTSIAEKPVMERRWSVVGAPWNRSKKRAANVPATKTAEVAVKTDDDASNVLAGLSPMVSLPSFSISDADKEESVAARKSFLKGKALFNDDDDGSGRDHEDDDKYLRSEYEAIKERVSAIETRISQEFGSIMGTVDRVEDQYQQTLEQTIPIEASCTSTDQLAKRLSRELKIRRSSEHKVMRSPSARKIGTIRRRSRENVRLSRNQSWHVASSVTGGTAKSIPPVVVSDLSFYPKTNLKRGRPNTIQTGLKHMELSPVRRPEEDSEQNSTVVVGQNFTDEEKQQDEKWTCAQNFFNSPSSQSKLDSFMDSTTADEVFKTPEVTTVPSRRTSLRPASGSHKKASTPSFVTRIELNVAKTPMLPPEIPPRKTPVKTPMLPPKTPGRTESSTALKTHLTPLQELQSGRASIARLRSQNAGMVMAKAKLFDGMVTSANRSGAQPAQLDPRRQSNRFVVKKNPDGSQHIKPLMLVPDKIQLRQVQKVRSSSHHNVKSPRRNTPHKRTTTKSPHGGINRRDKLRLVAAKSPGFHSPRVLSKLQENPDISVCLSPNLYDLDNKTPHAKKPIMRNSPRRIVGKTPQGRENRLAVVGQRKQTPLKGSKLAMAPASTSSPFSPSLRSDKGRCESPRLLAAAANSAVRRSSSVHAAIRP